MSDAAESRSASDRGNSDSGPSSGGFSGPDSGGWGGGGYGGFSRDNGLGEVPSLSTPDYGLSTGTTNTGLSANVNTSANAGDAISSGPMSVGLAGDLGVGVDRFGNINYGLSNGNSSFNSSGSAGLSVNGVGAPLSSFIGGSTSVYSPSLGRVQFSQLSPAEQEQQAANILSGLPGYYNGAEKGFREKFVDGMNWGLDKTGLIGQSMKDLGVKPGMSFDEGRDYEKNTPGAAQTRYERMNDIAGGLANIALSVAPGGGLVKAGVGLAKNMENGMSFKDALSLAVSDSLKGYAVGAINKEVGKALGPELAGGIGQFNKTAAVANLLGAGVPTIPSVGGMIVGAVAGPQSGGATLNASGQPMTDLSGDRVYGGFSSGSVSSGGRDTSQPSTPAQPSTPPAETPSPDVVDASGFKDARGFGQAFKAAARSRYRR